MKRRVGYCVAFLLVVMLILAGCRALPQKNAEVSQAPRAGSSNASFTLNDSLTFGNYASMDESSMGESIERKMIMTARLELTVDNLVDLEQRIVSLVTNHGGHIQRSFFNNREGNQYWEFTLRIPVGVYEQGISDISALGKVLSSSSNGQDVTEEYMDLAARLRVLERQESELLALLTKAVGIEDYLKVETHLNRVRIDIEQTTGRLKYLSNRVDLATIELFIRPAQGVVSPDLKGFAGLGQQIKVAFMRGINGLVALVVGFLVAIASLAPFLVLIVPVVLLLLVLLRRRRNNTKPPLSM